MSLKERLDQRAGQAHLTKSGMSDLVAEDFGQSGVAFACSNPAFEERYDAALGELSKCIKDPLGTGPILQEGGVYDGCWLESTGTINTELLSRFVPGVAQNTFSAFAANQRDDGLFPYKLTKAGPVWAQIQTVTPLARSVWTHYTLNGRDKVFLKTMYDAMARNDAWLAEYRDTRGTGAVEAFCTYDTGHDLSSRFWHMPDSPYHNDPARYDPDNPLLPLIAPDLTANVACQRDYLAMMAEELGEEDTDWRGKAAERKAALFKQCYDEADGYFYDRDRNGNLIRVQSDVLLRVLTSDIVDDAFFDASLSRYLLNTSKFFARFPFTSIAMDDPRFDPGFGINSWNGPSNFLSIIRAAHGFERHNRHVEFTWVLTPILFALFHFDRFPQTVSPFTGEAGFTESYSPSILCLLDFVERLSGIQPRPNDELWFTGLTPKSVLHRDEVCDTAYRRKVGDTVFELENSRDRSVAWRNGELLFDGPAGIRVATDRSGEIQGVTGVSARRVAGTLQTATGAIEIDLGPNDLLDLTGSSPQLRQARPLIPPQTS